MSQPIISLNLLREVVSYKYLMRVFFLLLYMCIVNPNLRTAISTQNTTNVSHLTLLQHFLNMPCSFSLKFKCCFVYLFHIADSCCIFFFFFMGGFLVWIALVQDNVIGHWACLSELLTTNGGWQLHLFLQDSFLNRFLNLSMKQLNIASLTWYLCTLLLYLFIKRKVRRCKCTSLVASYNSPHLNSQYMPFTKLVICCEQGKLFLFISCTLSIIYVMYFSLHFITFIYKVNWHKS